MRHLQMMKWATRMFCAAAAFAALSGAPSADALVGSVKRAPSVDAWHGQNKIKQLIFNCEGGLMDGYILVLQINFMTNPSDMWARFYEIDGDIVDECTGHIASYRLSECSFLITGDLDCGSHQADITVWGYDMCVGEDGTSGGHISWVNGGVTSLAGTA